MEIKESFIITVLECPETAEWQANDKLTCELGLISGALEQLWPDAIPDATNDLCEFQLTSNLVTQVRSSYYCLISLKVTLHNIINGNGNNDTLEVYCTYSTSANIRTDLLQFRYLTASTLVHKLLQQAPEVLPQQHMEDQIILT